jgi:dUTP pyrophosphatase
MVDIKIEKIFPDAILPSYSHPRDAGMDLFSYETYILKPGERRLFKTGLKVEIQEGYEMQIRPRSGLALNHGVTVLNTPGTIDAGYRGEVGVILINHGEEVYSIGKGDKIAQAVISSVKRAVLEEVEKLEESSRGEGGFGSTGK